VQVTNLREQAMTKKSAVKSEDFHHYVPAIRSEHIRNECWNSLAIDTFDFPAVVDDVETPAINEHAYIFAGVLGLKRNQELYGGELKLNRRSVYTGKKYQGSSYLIPRMNSASWNWTSASGHGFWGSCVYFSQALLEKVAEEALGMKRPQVELLLNMNVDDDFLSQIVYELSKDAGQSSPINRLYAETLTQAFVLHLLKHYCAYKQQPQIYKKRLSPTLLNQIIDYMNDNISDSLGLDELAGLTGLSTYYFIRLFKQSTGKSPHQYLVGLRMQKAKVLLSSTNTSVIDIAYTSGYASPSSFAYVFKQSFGVSPSQYRRQLL